MFVDNNWYGQRSILSEYCDIADTNAFAYIQHGALIRITETDFKKSKINHIKYLCWNERIKKIIDKNCNANAIIIGAPFIYLDHMMRKNINLKDIKTNGTIVFPTKSTYELNRDIDYNALIEFVEKNYEGPYSISIYYSDLHKNLDVIKKKKWKVVSFGKRTDTNFLEKFYSEIIKYDNVICSSINSAFYYSCYLKIKTTLFFQDFDANSSVLHNDKKLIKSNHIILKENLGLKENKLSKEMLYNLASKELGHFYRKTPTELKSLLGWSSFAKKNLARILSIGYDLIDIKNKRYK
jgi:hypothetical protein